MDKSWAGHSWMDHSWEDQNWMDYSWEDQNWMDHSWEDQNWDLNLPSLQKKKVHSMGLAGRWCHPFSLLVLYLLTLH